MTQPLNLTVDQVLEWLLGLAPGASKRFDDQTAAIRELQRAAEAGEVECVGREGSGGKRAPIPADDWPDLEIWFSEDDGYWRAAERGWRPFSRKGPSEELPQDLALYAGGRTWIEEDLDDAGWHDLRFRRPSVHNAWPSQRLENKRRNYASWAREYSKAPVGQKRSVAAAIAKREGVDRATVEREARRAINSPQAGKSPLR